MENNINAKIIKAGKIQNATKLPVITIGLGKVKDLKDVPGVIWHDKDGQVVIATKESPEGCLYDQDRTVVVRVIGGKVLIGGLYDIYAPNENKIAKLLSNPIILENYLEDEQLAELKPILEAASEVVPSLAPAEPGRRVIVITQEMVGDAECIYCHCPWDPDEVTVKLFVGDVFLVEDEATAKGYRIGKEEFELTHELG